MWKQKDKIDITIILIGLIILFISPVLHDYKLLTKDTCLFYMFMGMAILGARFWYNTENEK